MDTSVGNFAKGDVGSFTSDEASALALRASMSPAAAEPRPAIIMLRRDVMVGLPFNVRDSRQE